MNGGISAMDKLVATYFCVLICTTTYCFGREADYTVSARFSSEANGTFNQSKVFNINKRKMLSYKPRYKELTDELWVIDTTTKGKKYKTNVVEIQFLNIKTKDESIKSAFQKTTRTSFYTATTTPQKSTVSDTTPMYTDAPTKPIQSESVTTPMFTEAPTTPMTTEISNEEDNNETIMLIRQRRGAGVVTVTTQQPSTSIEPTYRDECRSNPCQKGGTCLDDVNSYRCDCVVGYTGSNCDIDIDECGSNPCQNGGTCHGRVNSYTCTCVFGYTGPNCNIVIKTCPVNIDERRRTWNQTLPGQTRIQWCPNNNSVEITRRCDDTGMWMLPRYNCVRDIVQNAQATVSALKNTSSSSDVDNAVRALENVSSPNTQNVADDTLTDGELSTITSSLETVASLVTTETLTDIATDAFVETASNLIDDTNSKTWKTLQESDDGGAQQVVSAIDTLAKSLTKRVNASNDSKKTIQITKKNLALEIKKIQNEDVLFPNSSANYINNQSWIKESKSSLHLPVQALPAKQDTQYVITTVMYRNMSESMPTVQKENVSTDKKQIINGPVMSLTITPPLQKLDPPLQIIFEHLTVNKGYGKPTCNYWLFQSTKQGYWSTDGCMLVSSNTTQTICKCNHLTNFAVLMSPFQEGSADSVGLRIASIVGISVSLLGLLITLVVHFCLWRYVKSDRATILMNLCGALIVSYIVFLAGVDRIEAKAFCTVVAVVLHYIYLVVFSLMLALSIEIASTVVHVFAKQSRIKILLSLAWLIPAVVVAISVGVTRAEGYGNEHFCWLSVKSGLIWAFVGPASAIIVFNLICLILVMRTMFTTKTMKQKKKQEQIKTSVRSLCVLVPLMGLSWIVGIFYINEDLFWTQYVFAVCNGLQGVFICLFHCLLNHQIKRAIQLSNRKRLSRATLRSSLNNRLLQDSVKQSDHGQLGSQPAGLVTFPTGMRRAAVFDSESRDRLSRNDMDSDIRQNQMLGERL